MRKLGKIISILLICVLLSMLTVPQFSYAEPTNDQSSTTKHIIALDPGHGNNGDPGATNNGLKERTLIEKTVNYIKQYLEQNNFTVVIIGPWEGRDTGISLSGRFQNAKNANAEFILSVHYNAGGGEGTEVLWKNPAYKNIAENMSKNVSEATGLNNRGAKHYRNGTGRSISLPSLGPENSSIPAVLIEGGFIDSSDRNIISTEEGLQKIAQGAVKTITQYFNSPASFGEVSIYNNSLTSSGSGGGIQSAGKGITEIKGNEYKFLGLWRNAVGEYVPYYNEDGTINSDAVYKKDGKLVYYKNFGSPVDSFLNSADWLSDLLKLNERTQEHDKIMKYLMYVYSGTDYGVTEYDFSTFDIESFSPVGSGGYGEGSVVWNNSITKEEFINICKNYVPNSESYKNGWNKIFLANIDKFYDLSVEAKINPMFTVAVGVHESGFGTSKICNDKNNIYGYRAEDSNAYGLAWKFDSINECISHWTKWIAGNYVYDQHYYDPKNQPESEKNDASYRYDMIVEKGKDPTTVEGIGSIYASDGSWAAKVKEHWINIFGDSKFTTASSSASGITQKAQECIDKLNERGVVYNYGSGAVPMTDAHKSIDCSHYVSWVLYECGYKFGYWTSADFAKNQLNWEKITDKANLQPGDILVYDGHVDIYAGPGSDGSNNKIKKYNAGATNSIRQSPYEGAWRSGYKFALRPSK